MSIPTRQEAASWEVIPLPRPRSAQRAIALAGGYFWLPCPLCGRKFGGHEWKDRHMFETEPGRGKGFCPGHRDPDEVGT